MKGNEMAKRDPKAAAVSTADKCIKAEAAKAESKPAPQTDEERAVLFYQWKDKYRAAAFDKKVADDALKAVASGAKAELGKNAVKDIKLAIELEDNPGEADIALQKSIEDQLRVARWMGSSVGTQFEMFPGPDRARSIRQQRDDDGKLFDALPGAEAEGTFKVRV